MSFQAKALVITKTDPAAARDGGSIRVAQLIRALQNRGWETSTLSVERARRTGDRRFPGPSVLRVLGSYLKAGSVSAMRWFSPALVAAIQHHLREQRPDVVIVEYSQLYPYALLSDVATVHDLHNIESELMANYAHSAHGLRKAIATFDQSALARLERRIAEGKAPVFVVSDHDADRLKDMSRNSGAPVVVVPNGVDASFFEITKSTATPLRVVFIGQLGWRPNIDAATWLAREVWPKVLRAQPDALLEIIGRNPSPVVQRLGDAPSVSVHGDVPSTAPFLKAANVATAPLLSAGGTRLKILEAVGAATPVVATSLGALGLESLADDPGVMQIADTADAFAAAILSIGSRPIPAERLRAAAAPFEWARALRPAVETLDQLLRDR